MTRLSLCMIVRNEAAVLERCLESVEGLVDEVVIVDTGSQDNTKNMAKEYGCNVFEYNWNDDFSAARNFSLEKASGDWVLVLDADETISKRDHSQLKAMIDDEGVDAYSLVQRTYGNALKDDVFVSSQSDRYSESKPYYGWIPSRLVRLFRNDPDYRFQYRIHELIEPSITNAGGVIQDTVVPIHHFAYEKDQDYIRDKHQRYLNIGLQQVIDTPSDPKPYNEAASVYMSQSKMADAERLLLEGITQMPDAAILYNTLGTLYVDSKRMSEAEDILEKGLKLKPDDLLMLNKLASARMAMGKYSEALLLLEEAKKIQPNFLRTSNNLGLLFALTNRALDAIESFKHSLQIDQNNFYALTNLGMILVKVARFSEARPFLERALKINDEDGRVLFHLAVACANLGQKGRAKKLLGKAKKIHPEDAAILKVLRQLG